MEIPDKYTRLLGKYIYHKRLDKFGQINTISITSGFGYGISLKAYCGKFNDDVLIFFEDFEKGEVQFTLITGIEALEEYNRNSIDDIKAVFGDKFSDSMLMYIDADERMAHIREEEKRDTQKLHTDLVSLTDVSANVLANDFYSRELYLKYKSGVIDEKQMLYAIVNHLSQEYKRVDDCNSEYFFKYVFPQELSKMEPKAEL